MVRKLMANGIDKKFERKVVVVTGGTSGIGEACVREFAGEGAEVYALGLNAKASPLSGMTSVHVIEMDVTDDETLSAFFAGLNRVDFIVPAAGISVADKEHEPEVFDRVMAINLTAVMRCCTLGRAKMTGGAIVLIASMYSTFGSSQRPAYAASKGAIVQLTKSLAQSYASANIRVNAVAPGWIDTPLLAPLKADEQVSEIILGRTPLARFGDPSELAKAIMFLCSNDASFITGVTLPVDGGYLTV